ncbi:MAG TPA: hypothetical protein VFI61_03095 [Patescibacteria group bacterium]|nr:hypothetical protein [Patescibacteria group bacterium]
MTKYKVFLLLSSLIVFLSTAYSVLSTASAQTFDAEKAYLDYQFSLTTYDKSFTEYQDARDFYLKSQTLTLKEDARIKTVKMLESRDQLEIVYLTALRMKILETKGISNDDKNRIFGNIDSEVEYYKKHIENYKDDDSLENLFNKNGEAESRYKSNTSPIIYESLFLISLGEQIGIRNDNELEYGTIKDFINSGVASGKLQMNPFNRWLGDIDSVIESLKKNESLASTQIQNIHGQFYSVSSSYQKALDTLTVSSKLLTQLNGFLIEVLTSIKNQQ